MQPILSKLNRVQGIAGSMVVNKDGIVAASEFNTELDEASLGAVSSSILAALVGATKRLQLGDMRRYLITGNAGKLAIVDTGPALLLVVLRHDVNMGMVNVEIQEAARSIAERAKM